MQFRLKLLLFLTIIICILYFASPTIKFIWLMNFAFFEGSTIIRTITLMFSITAIGVAIIIFLENRNPARTLTWIILLAIFPLFGFFFYLLFGQNYQKKRIYRKKAIIDQNASELLKQSNYEEVEEFIANNKRLEYLINIASKQSNIPVTMNTETKVLTNGSETFPKIIEELKKAKHHIHIEFYIVRDDEIGKQIKEILIDKAKNGVKVRFLYDAVGSWKLSRSFVRDLLKEGVEVLPFSPVKIPVINDTINYRNHRKIIVIDSKVGFVGGLNIGDEYLGKNLYFGKWRDTHLFLNGEGVRSLQFIFLQDWYYMTNEIIDDKNYFDIPIENKHSTGAIQLVSGGPDRKNEVIKDLFFAMITSARESIQIASPYFVPDEDLLTALKVASNGGVKVKILIPDRPDKKIVFYASRSYFPELLEAGVEIFEYKQGFLHSKILIVDGEVASVGTANMDMRSFHLNFEVTAFLYLEESIKHLVKDFNQDIIDSDAILLSDFKKRAFYKRIFESLSRLMAPLL
ncbi:cardiolipin synthase [Bacillus sp. EAC]|uniref:cardiolipin synthase n=1 Tax=Bacillus sp. EAC TaxID=1978338 RepID=UPI000B453D9A|nr:cardiolipin synthase [Bacillus sp. EAC]